MKKSIVIFIAGLLSWHPVSAQYAFEKGAVVLQPGISYSSIGTEGQLAMKPVSLGLEFGVGDEWSAGGYVSYASSKRIYSSVDLQLSSLLLSGRLSFHMNTDNETFDPYLGIMLGYITVSATARDGFASASASAGAALYGGQLGFRYYFSPSFGFFAEAGYGFVAESDYEFGDRRVTAGLSFKLNGARRHEVPPQAESRIWERWNSATSRARAEDYDEEDEYASEEYDIEEPEEEKEIVLRVRVINMQRNLLIVDAGQNKGMRTGARLKVYPVFEGKISARYAMPAVVTRVRTRNAIVKITNAKLAAMLTIGDELALKIAPAAAENY